jgi:hypothetical protein
MRSPEEMWVEKKKQPWQSQRCFPGWSWVVLEYLDARPPERLLDYFNFSRETGKRQKNRYLRHFSSWRPINRISCLEVCNVNGRGRRSNWIPASSGVRSPFWLLHW